jgi:isopentenyl-diphosphate delta-isomerase
MEQIILVDRNDSETGSGEKMDVHRNGQLHRAFSIFVFNSRGETLLQQRAEGKYHSAGLWTNTCCSHPRTGESLEEAVHRRLKEEMGFDCNLREAFSFIYRSEFGNGLTEHEFDHVFVGRFDGIPSPDKSEVSSFRWVGLEELIADIKNSPEKYTYWLKDCIGRVAGHVKANGV